MKFTLAYPATAPCLGCRIVNDLFPCRWSWNSLVQPADFDIMSRVALQVIAADKSFGTLLTPADTTTGAANDEDEEPLPLDPGARASAGHAGLRHRGHGAARSVVGDGASSDPGGRPNMPRSRSRRSLLGGDAGPTGGRMRRGAGSVNHGGMESCSDGRGLVHVGGYDVPLPRVMYVLGLLQEGLNKHPQSGFLHCQISTFYRVLLKVRVVYKRTVARGKAYREGLTTPAPRPRTSLSMPYRLTRFVVPVLQFCLYRLSFPSCRTSTLRCCISTAPSAVPQPLTWMSGCPIVWTRCGSSSSPFPTLPTPPWDCYSSSNCRTPPPPQYIV